MKIGLVGAREGRTREEVCAVLSLFVKQGDTIISGGARGVDTFAGDYARINGLEFIAFLPDFKRCTDESPYKERNRLIAQTCDILLAFPTNSGGTWQTIAFAKGLNKRVFIVREANE